MSKRYISPRGNVGWILAASVLIALAGCSPTHPPAEGGGFIPSNYAYRSPPPTPGWTQRKPPIASSIDVVRQYEGYPIFISSGSRNRSLVYNTLREDGVAVVLGDDVGLAEAFVEREGQVARPRLTRSQIGNPVAHPIEIDGNEGRYISIRTDKGQIVLAAVALPEVIVFFQYEARGPTPAEVRVRTLLDFQALLKNTQLYR